MINGEPIFFNKTKLILSELFFLSLSIKDKILFKSFELKNLFIFDGKFELLRWLIINHILNSKLPSNINNFFNINDLNKIVSFMLKDKKNNSDKISLVLLKKIGSPLINEDCNKKTVMNFLKTELSDQNLD